MSISFNRSNQAILLTILIITILILAAINPSILWRSPWGDEASLLRNLKIIPWTGAFFPLPLFDLTAPPGATLVLQVIAELTQYDVTVIRLILLLINLGFIYWAAYATKISNKVVPFVLFWLSTPVVYYATEIKQYSLEMVASYLMIVTIATTTNEWKSKVRDVCALVLSFGAIVQVASRFIMSGYNAHLGRWAFSRGQIYHVTITALLLVLFVVWGRYLTTLQLANFHAQAFKNNGLLIDFLRFCKAIFMAHGAILVSIGAIVTALAIRTFGWRPIVHNHLVIFLLLCVAMVSILRLAGFYPVVYPRHIVWIVPVSLFIVATWLDKLLIHWGRSWNHAVKVAGMVVAASVLMWVPMERSFDKGLFSALAKLPPRSDVVLNLGAQVALDLYMEQYPSLSELNYYGWVNAASAPTIPETVAMSDFTNNASKPGAFSSWTYFVLNQDFHPLWRYLLDAGQRPDFFIATSGQTPTNDPVLDDSAKAMVELMRDRGCGFNSVYAGYLVEILSVRCSKVATLSRSETAP